MSGWDTSRLHDTWQEDYERGRPGWPEAVLEVVPVDRGATVVDVGAGTGKLTRVLLGHYRHVVAIEPDAGMRRLLAALCSGVDASAESLPLDDTSADAIFAAEAFHRFDAAAALAEFGRALRPHGVLALLWNTPGEPTDAAVNEASDLLRARAPAVPHDAADLNTERYADGSWREPFANAPFEPLRDVEVAHEQQVTREELLAFFASMGWLSELAGDERASILAEVEALLPAPAYRRTWVAHVHWTRRT